MATSIADILQFKINNFSKLILFHKEKSLNDYHISCLVNLYSRDVEKIPKKNVSIAF